MSLLFRPALVTFAALTLVTGIVYPLTVTGAARLFFPAQASGSLLYQKGQTVGSALIAQHTEDPRYFWGRLSATPGFPTNAGASGGANRSGANPELRQAALTRLEALRAADPGNLAPVPVDLVTTSGSGLDPHISPLAARYQLARVARNRGMTETDLGALVSRYTLNRQWGLFGEPRVKVLELNLALDARP